MNILSVVLSFFKVGLIGFGGGAALIPVIKDELVDKKKWISKENFDFSLVVASVSPASLPVALCSVWNKKYSLISAYVYALPGPILFLLLSTGFSLIGEAGVRLVGFASVGIIAFILLVIASFIERNYRQADSSGIRTQYIFIIAATFILTGGNITRRLLIMFFNATSLPASIFSLSMLDLILIAFFVIFFLGSSKSKSKICLSIVISLLFALSRGRADIISGWATPLIAIMTVLAAASVLFDRKKEKNVSAGARKVETEPLINLMYFALISAVLTTVVFLMSGDAGTWEFAARVAAASLTSFGGGEAFIGVADAFFVQSGFVSEQVYYSRIIGVSSAMPGPVLMSIAAGVGFAFGSAIGGVGTGWMFGMLAIALSVAATALGALLLYTCFKVFSDSIRLKMIIKYMMPIVCGLLITIFLSLFYQAVTVFSREGISPLIGAGLVLVFLAAMYVLRMRFRLKDVPLLLAGGCSSLLLLLLII